MRFTSLRLIVGIFLLFCASTGFAQTGADLLIKPWPEGVKDFEVRGDALSLSQGYVKKTDNNFTLAQYETEGRFRIIPGEVISPRVGFDAKYFDLGGGYKQLPGQLSDTSIALGAGVLEKNGWIFALKAGVGYAGPQPFTDGNAFYGLFDFVVGHKIDDNSQIGFVLDYDGNRSTYRDVPLPGFAYRFWTYRHQIQIAVGFPYDSIELHPTQNTSVELVFSIPDDLRIFAAYEFIPHWSAFGTVYRTIDTFYWDQTANVNDRLFFQQRRAELGIQYSPNEALDFRLAAGYAWDQTFGTGFTANNTDRIAAIADEPYVRFGIVWKY
ncbi:hypothetical protein BH10PLA1_BH10PLA1_19960 [soil metagenome]